MLNKRKNRSENSCHVVFITPPLSPGRLSMLAELARMEGIFLKTLITNIKDPIRKYDVQDKVPFPAEMLPTWTFRVKRKKGHHEYRTVAVDSTFFRLITEVPDVVIAVGFSVPCAQAMLYCKLFRKPFISFSTSTCFSEKFITPAQKWLRKFIIARCDGHIVVSTEAAEYIRSFEKHSPNIGISLQTTDIRFIADEVYKYKQGLPARKEIHILYIGQLINRKGVWQLMELIKNLKDCPVQFILDMVGDGPLRADLEDFCYKEGLESIVKFHGWVSYANLPIHLANADLFILLTLEDTFAVVINEALAAGLPVICSCFAGAAHDLICDNKNGFIVDPSNIEDVVRKTLLLIENDKLRKQMGKRSTEIIQKHTPLASVRRIKEVVDIVC